MAIKLKKHFIIGIASRHQHGKDTVAKYLQWHLTLPATIYPIANPLKEDIVELVNGEMRTLELNKIDPRLRWILEKYGTEYPHEKTLLVRFQEWLNEFSSPTLVILTGIRRPSEAQYVRETLGGLVVLVERRENEGDTRIINY